MLKTPKKTLNPNQEKLSPEEQKQLLKQIEDIEKVINVHKVEERPEELAEVQRALEEEEMFWLDYSKYETLWDGYLTREEYVKAN